MFLLVRSSYHDNKVLGIINEAEIFAAPDYHEIEKMINARTEAGLAFPSDADDAVMQRIARVVNRNLDVKTVGDYNVPHWYWEEISQAEYETYRDLHGFRVFIKVP